jgi:hypothetical protein
MMGRNDDEIKFKKGRFKAINAEIGWKKYLELYSQTSRAELINYIAGILLQTKRAVSADIINQYSDTATRESFIKSSTIQLMSTPEYQLC